MQLYDILAGLFDVLDDAIELQTIKRTLRLWVSDEVTVSMAGCHHLSLTPFSEPLASDFLTGQFHPDLTGRERCFQRYFKNTAWLGEK